MNKLNSTIKHDLIWVDYIRVMACLLVVLAHCCDAYVSNPSKESFMAGSIWGTLYRPSVPLFIMISGVLLLPTSMRISEFYNRRIKRILGPFIFWSILSPILFYFFAASIDTINTSVNPDNLTISKTINYLWLWIFNFNFSTIPYWYIYMMLGVYLIIPIISNWVKDATKKELQLVIKIWIFTTFIQYIQIVLPFLGYNGNYGSFGIFGESPWNIYTTFQYLSGFIGYAILGSYLRKYPIQWSITKTIIFSLIIWGIGYFISFEGFHFVKNNFPENYNMLEIPWSYTSFNVVMMTIPIFILIQKINPKPRRIITIISDYSFGIFLSHFIFVHLIYEFVARYIIVIPILQLFIVFIFSFIITALFVALLRKIPLLNKFV